MTVAGAEMCETLKEKLTENKYEYYYQILFEHHGKVFSINDIKWKFEVDSMSGSFGFESIEHYVYATPYWEGDEACPVEVCDLGGNCESHSIPLEETLNPNIDVDKYFSKIVAFIENYDFD
jgi:hypothetical protein